MNPKANDMVERSLEKLGPLLSSIGEHLAAEIGGDPNGIFLYVEVGDRWISVNVFRDDGDVVRYYRHGSGLTDVIWDFWKAPEPAKRWAVMEYEITGTKFDAKFKYPEEVDVESFDTDRREIALKRRFGDKPVIYPPPPAGQG
jgi:hypothetical protein